MAAIVELSSDAIISKDLNGIIMSWNAAAGRIFGYSAEETIGRPVTILIPQERHSEEEAIFERLRRGERIDHFETVRIRKDGSPVDISLTISPIRNAQGRITGASKIARDISERKQSEAKIELLAREAEHRTRNVLATVQATVNLTRSDTAESLREAIQGRVQALANVHKLFGEFAGRGPSCTKLSRRSLPPIAKPRVGAHIPMAPI